MTLSYPGLEVLETNLAQQVIGPANIAAAVVGASNRGRINERILVTNTKEFLNKFGNPDASLSYMHYAALQYLRQGDELYVTRVANAALHGGVVINGTGGSTNSSALSSGVVDPSTFSFSGFANGVFAVFADNPGAWGNSISVRITNVNTAELTFDIQVYETVSGSSILRETYTVSRQLKTDGFGRQLFLEDKINNNSDYIRVKNNANLSNTILPRHNVVSDVIGTGNGTNTNFTITLSQPNIVPGSVTTSGGGESFTDNFAGDMIGSSGSTGTINYITGSISLIFNTPPANLASITASYEYAIVGTFTQASNGSTITDAQLLSGWDLYNNTEEVDVRLLIDPGYTSLAVKQRLVQIAETRKDSLAIIHVPTSEQEASRAVIWRRNTSGINSTYAAAYTSDVLDYDQYNSVNLYVPVTGYVAAQFAKNFENNTAGSVPAGTDTTLNVQSLYQTYDSGDQSILYTNQVNYIRRKPGTGFLVWGNRTLTSQVSPLNRINVRMLLIIIERGIKDSLDDVIFKLNNEFTRLRVSQRISSFLQQFADSGDLDTSIDNGFFVKCDEDNNPPAVR